jgi:hypothetical protein
MEPTAPRKRSVDRLTVDQFSDDEDDAAFELPAEYASVEDLEDPQEDDTVDGAANYAHSVDAPEKPPPIVGVINRVTKLSREYSGYSYMPEEAVSPAKSAYYAELPVADSSSSSSSVSTVPSPRVPPIVLPPSNGSSGTNDIALQASVALPMRTFSLPRWSLFPAPQFLVLRYLQNVFSQLSTPILASPKPPRSELKEASPGARNWNEEFQTIIGEPISKARFEKLASLANDFCYAAKQYGKIIISFASGAVYVII